MGWGKSYTTLWLPSPYFPSQEYVSQGITHPVLERTTVILSTNLGGSKAKHNVAPVSEWVEDIGRWNI